MTQRREITVDVTQEDIDHGCRGNSGGCPVARALARHYAWVAVGPSMLSVGGRGWTVLDIPLPRSVRDCIARFDRGEEMEPFSFVLNIASAEEVIP